MSEESKKESRLSKFLDWCDEHKEPLLILVPVAVAGVKLASKGISLYKTQHLQNRTCYDRKLGHYWQLKRTLSNDEWLAIDKRIKNGERMASIEAEDERMADILKELRVLK